MIHFSLTPNGDVDGLILADGTEIHTPPHLGPQLVQIVKPGDQVLAHGLRARSIPVMEAVSVTNVETGQSVTDPRALSALRPGDDAAPQPVSVSGVVRMQLHGPKGDFNGVLLEDGTIVRLPPHEARRLADQFRPGQSITVSGQSVSGPNGRVVAVDRLAPAPGTPRP